MTTNNKTNSHNRVVAYIRKSSEDPKEKANKQINSFEYQEKAVRSLIKHNNLILVDNKIFKEDKTGYKANIRHQFHQMLEFIRDRENEIDGIVCYDVSRLARNFGDGGQILWFLQSNKISRIYTDDKTFTDSSTDQLLLAVVFALAKHSSDQTGKKAKEGSRIKAFNKNMPPQAPVWGYDGVGKKGERKWVVNKKESKLVKKIFEEVGSGRFKTQQDIANYAESIGVKNPNSKKPYSKNALINRLRDKKYTGYFDYEDEEDIDGAYTAIISEELFQRVQKALSKKTHPKTSNSRTYAYSPNMIKCHRCGSNMTGTHKKGINYYRCGKKHLPCKGIKKVNYINEGKFEERLANAFQNIEIDNDKWAQARKYASEICELDQAKYRQEINSIRDKIDIEKEKLAKNTEAKVNGEIDELDYKNLRERYRNNIKKLRKQEVIIENELHQLRSLMDEFMDDVKNITKRFKKASPSVRKQLVLLFCENLEWDGEKVRWSWKKPYYFLSKRSKKSGVLPG